MPTGHDLNIRGLWTTNPDSTGLAISFKILSIQDTWQLLPLIPPPPPVSSLGKSCPIERVGSFDISLEPQLEKGWRATQQQQWLNYWCSNSEMLPPKKVESPPSPARDTCVISIDCFLLKFRSWLFISFCPIQSNTWSPLFYFWLPSFAVQALHFHQFIASSGLLSFSLEGTSTFPGQATPFPPLYENFFLKNSPL